MIGESGVNGALVHFSHHCRRSPAQPTVKSLLRPRHCRARATSAATRAAVSPTSHPAPAPHPPRTGCDVTPRRAQSASAGGEVTPQELTCPRLPGLIGAIRTPPPCPAHPGAARGDLSRRAARDPTPTTERRVSTSARAPPGPLRRPRTHLAGSTDPAKRQRTLRGPCHAPGSRSPHSPDPLKRLSTLFG